MVVTFSEGRRPFSGSNWNLSQYWLLFKAVLKNFYPSRGSMTSSIQERAADTVGKPIVLVRRSRAW